MRLSRGYASLPFALVGLLLLCFVARPRELNRPAQALPQSAMTRLNVLVLDDKNHPVPDLGQEDFQVFEGDVPQKVTFFSKEDQPVSYGLVIDSSASMRSQFKDVLEAARIIVSSKRADDEVFLIRFISADKIELANEFTTDKTALLDKLNMFQIEGGQSAIVDALYVSADHLAKHEQGKDMTRGRRALVLITDGEDRDAHYRKDELIKLLRQSGIQVFIIGLTRELDKEGGVTRKSPREKATDLLEGLDKETVGRAFFPTSSSEIKEAAAEIVSSLHTQYIIGYHPAAPDSKRKVRVKLTETPNHKKLRADVGPPYPVPLP